MYDICMCLYSIAMLCAMYVGIWYCTISIVLGQIRMNVYVCSICIIYIGFRINSNV